MSDEPANYIRAALCSLGVECGSLRVMRYEPAIFGNLLAEAETDKGGLRIIYDRGFFVELRRWADDALTADRIAEALEQHKIATANVR
jgi:hypothetical protein